MAQSFLKAQLFLSVAGLLAISAPGYAQDAAVALYKPANDIKIQGTKCVGKTLRALPPSWKIGKA